MGAKAGGCNSDHDFVCNCDCRPSAEAYADSFRPEREHMLVYVCHSIVRLLEVCQQYRQRGREQEQLQEREQEQATATATGPTSTTATGTASL